MRKSSKITLGALLIIMIFVCFLYISNGIGTPKSRLESDARSSQKIEDSWLMEKDVSDTMAALIAYPEDQSDYVFSIYVDRPGLSFGYFFRGGGECAGIENHIINLRVEGYNEHAFISMNSMSVERLEIDNGNTVKVIKIDSKKPFALVLPRNAGNIAFYDVNGNIVETYQTEL